MSRSLWRSTGRQQKIIRLMPDVMARMDLFLEKNAESCVCFSGFAL
jgi:hypothetical protein